MYAMIRPRQCMPRKYSYIIYAAYRFMRKHVYSHMHLLIYDTCIPTYACIHKYTCTVVYWFIRVHPYMPQIDAYVYIYILIYTYTFIYWFIRIHVHFHVCIYIYLWIRTYTFIFSCIHIHINVINIWMYDSRNSVYAANLLRESTYERMYKCIRCENQHMNVYMNVWWTTYECIYECMMNVWINIWINIWMYDSRNSVYAANLFIHIRLFTQMHFWQCMLTFIHKYPCMC